MIKSLFGNPLESIDSTKRHESSPQVQLNYSAIVNRQHHQRRGRQQTVGHENMCIPFIHDGHVWDFSEIMQHYLEIHYLFFAWIYQINFVVEYSIINNPFLFKDNFISII